MCNLRYAARGVMCNLRYAARGVMCNLRYAARGVMCNLRDAARGVMCNLRYVGRHLPKLHLAPPASLPLHPPGEHPLPLHQQRATHHTHTHRHLQRCVVSYLHQGNNRACIGRKPLIQYHAVTQPPAVLIQKATFSLVLVNYCCSCLSARTFSLVIVNYCCSCLSAQTAGD
jgi:hypothetical protein